MEHSEVVVTAAEPDLDDALARAIRQLIRGAMSADADAQTKTGAVILEHDGGGDRSQTVAALKVAIPRLLGEGYRFTVP